jgi:hypothetical protein
VARVPARTPALAQWSAPVESGTPGDLGDHDLLGLLGSRGDEPQRHCQHHRDLTGREADDLERTHDALEPIGQAHRRGSEGEQ